MFDCIQRFQCLSWQSNKLDSTDMQPRQFPLQTISICFKKFCDFLKFQPLSQPQDSVSLNPVPCLNWPHCQWPPLQSLQMCPAFDSMLPNLTWSASNWYHLHERLNLVIFAAVKRVKTAGSEYVSDPRIIAFICLDGPLRTFRYCPNLRLRQGVF